MSYRFNGTSDYVEFALGPLASYTLGPVTMAAFVRNNSDPTGDHALMAFTNSGLTIKFLYRFTGGELQLNNPAVGASGTALTLTSTSLFYLAVVSWAGGAALPRFHVHNGTSWTHVNGVGTLGNYTLTAGDRFRVGAWSANFLPGDLVCAGIKKGDSTDLQVQALTRTAFSDWRAFGFDWLVGFDPSLVSGGLLQDQGAAGTGDELSRSGTSLVSDPSGWAWTSVATPVADFTGTPLAGTEPLSVTFTDASTNTPTSWAWTFGDGGTSTAQNPTHSYTAAGTYTVVLVATNAAGSNTKTRTGYVVVSDQPRPIRINTSQGWADIGDATSFVSGTGAPTSAVGATGAVYLDTATGSLYGPKAGGAWPGTPIGTIPAGGPFVPLSLLDAKGDLYAATANDTAAKVTVGTNGQVLTADSAQTAGVKWAPATATSFVSVASASTITTPSVPFVFALVTGTTRVNILTAQPAGYVVKLGSNGQGAGLPLIFTNVAAGSSGRFVFKGYKDCSLYGNLPYGSSPLFETVTLISNGNDWQEIDRNVVTVLDYVQMTANTASLPATPVAIIGSNTITYDGATPMIVEFFTPKVDYSANAVIHSLYDGPVLSVVGNQGVGSGTASGPFTGHHRLTPSAAAHVYTWVAQGLGGFIYAGTGVGGAVAPAYLKISRDL
jgi:PKD repeat protein